MSKIAIKAENISKQYRLGEIGTGTISHDLNRWWHKVRGKEDPFLKIGESNDRTQKGESDYVWSLKDINFEINQGDAVGIIGRNGAGKSTLLKLLSKVTKPTTGQFKVNGRIASLLEVGTGFHPEMTGRENIFLNGAILGMRRSEITRKFDEIVDFAGIERYIDTPVKRYSSGMYVRLAFSVAAHLESEILIVDEVLAVGDAEFQNRCLGKMGDINNAEGRTVLFVSHHLQSILNLCNKTILLSDGEIDTFDKTKHVSDRYIELGRNNLANYKFRFEGINLESDYYFEYFEFSDSIENPNNDYKSSDKLHLRFGIVCNKFNPSVIVNIILFNKENNKIFSIYKKACDLFKQNRNSINVEINLEIPENLLPNSTYFFQINTHIPGQKIFQIHEEVCNFTVWDDSHHYQIYPNLNSGIILPNYFLSVI